MPETLSEKVLMACARAAHETNRAYCIALGDDSQPPWEQAPDWQRKSAVVGVRGVLVDGNGPRESHESWLHEKRLDSWVYGPVKNPQTKEHPCMVEYDQLPPEHREKDLLFVAIVRAVAGALEGQV